MLRPCWLMFGSLVFSILVSMAEPAKADQTVVVVLDDSGSMERPMQGKQQRMAAAKQALTTVLQGLSSDTQVGVLALNSKVSGSHWILPVGSPDAGRWQGTLQQVHARGGTPLGEFIRKAADELLALRAKQPFSSYRLLVVTDGEASDATLLAGILPDLLSRGISLDVIGVDMQADHSLARAAHSYRRAGDQQALAQALTEVFAETVDDGQSSQADFDLLAGLPDDAAAMIVKSISAPRNEPLRISLQVAPIQESLPGSAPSVAASGGRGSSIFGTIVSTLCCVGGFGVAFLVLSSFVLRSARNKLRR